MMFLSLDQWDLVENCYDESNNIETMIIRDQTIRSKRKNKKISSMSPQGILDIIFLRTLRENKKENDS